MDEDQIEHYAFNGYYAFQDYAVSKWMDHVETVIMGKTAELLGEAEVGGEHQQAALHALQRFHEVYGNDILSTGTQDQFSSLTALTTPREQCQAFIPFGFYEKLVAVWASITKHQSLPSKDKDKPALPGLVDILKRTRDVLEDMFEKADDEESERLESLYGPRIYKCDHLRCKYFYEGFEVREVRDNHLNRHDRPFLCPIPGCSMIPFGFSTGRDQEKHVRNYHPDQSDQPSGFRRLEREVPANGRFICDICSRSFTRYANLEGHKNSHLGQRPYACTTCGKGFARMNDRRRHERVHRRR